MCFVLQSKVREIVALVAEVKSVLVIVERVSDIATIAKELTGLAVNSSPLHSIPQTPVGVYFTFRARTLAQLSKGFGAIVRCYAMHSVYTPPWQVYDSIARSILPHIYDKQPESIQFIGAPAVEFCEQIGFPVAKTLEFSNGSGHLYVATETSAQSICDAWQAADRQEVVFVPPSFLREIATLTPLQDFQILLPDKITIRKDATQFSASQLGAIIQNPLICFYQPTHAWQKQPASDKQVQWLARKIPQLVAPNLERGVVTEIIASIALRITKGLATPAQLLLLYKLDIPFNPHTLTLQEAKVLLANPPITEKQRQYLISLGAETIPTSRAEAKVTIDQLKELCSQKN